MNHKFRAPKASEVALGMDKGGEMRQLHNRLPAHVLLSSTISGVIGVTEVSGSQEKLPKSGTLVNSNLANVTQRATVISGYVFQGICPIFTRGEQVSLCQPAWGKRVARHINGGN